MNLRCREGDLALIIREEPGCDVNIGRVVKVVGPIEFVPSRGQSWLIEPTAAGPWSYVAPMGGHIITRPITLADRIQHPDAWLLPLHPDGAELAESSRREMPRETAEERRNHDLAEEASG